MLSDGFTSECNGATLGAKMPRVSSEFIQGLRFFLPPTKEQKAIADCMDKKTAQIDSIIRAREKKIQLLEELRTSIISKSVTKGIKKNVETKDSGIAWIGVIPKHWEETTQPDDNNVDQAIVNFKFEMEYEAREDILEYLMRNDNENNQSGSSSN